MRRTWRTLGLASVLLLDLAGCTTPTGPIKPTPKPEEFTLPPAGETRFSQPPTYPAKTLNEGMLRKDRDKDDAPPGMFRGPGGIRPGTGSPGSY
jgi:hypothetical protein